MAKAKRNLVICVDNAGYEVSLERRKFYEAIEDAAASKKNLIRVIDESGEDYLYPASLFVATELPAAVRRAVMRAA
jgi:hypothetical protein